MMKALVEALEKEETQDIPVWMDTCFWCGAEVPARGQNYAHVGGHGDVCGCDKCLGLKGEADAV